MQLSVIRTLPDMEALKEEWNGLLLSSASHVPFLRNEYLSAWWSGKGGGEWENGELFVITGRDPSGELVGIAPLFSVKNLEGVPALMLLGSIEISDYLDFIVRPDFLDEFVLELLVFLEKQAPSQNLLLDLYNLLEDSPTLAALEAASGRIGWRFSVEPLQQCPYIPLPGDWEAYLAGIDKKQRHEIRRKMRRAEEYSRPVRTYTVEDRNTLNVEIEAFFDLMAKDAKKEAFLTPSMKIQMEHIIQMAYDLGWLQLAFIEVGGRKAAGYLNLDYDDKIWVYNSGYDPDFREISPGWVLLAYLIKQANEKGRRTFDFLRGNEEYKYRFGAIDRRVLRARVSCP
jgi:CelD/BcsL family acetyltransferase involved in cellulose biosynthesis